ncbi:F-box and associated interaction domains-containing protein, putative isoform 1 [Hibiscus syriacus]|uniref:F-box and associated interaction domains-containing protein, putative isoform 1 n=1 Tax=Hibiscus syriacus TaxID=106335 RepID=A0A6A2Y047_HIBSY|nr:F-box and associated interaction domains-containing protein, putative isoform 1 [Hibiscus syriacus]
MTLGSCSLHLQAIESSLKCCVELKELRLAHNDIKSLPVELSYNKKLQNLDLVNNIITRWSELKQALDSLINLKNLNLQGNPIAEKDKLTKKVKRLLPNLQIFNGRPIDKSVKNKDGETIDIASHSMDYTEDIYVEDKKGQKRKKNLEFQVSVEKQYVNHDNAPDLDTEKELKRKKKKGNDKVYVDEGDDIVVEKKEKKKSKGEKENLSRLDAEKNMTQKGRKTNDKHSKKEVSVHEVGIAGEEKQKKKKTLEKLAELDIIDDSGAFFTELFATDAADPIEDGKRKIVDRASQEMKSSGHSVTYPAKKKKGKHAMLAGLQLSPTIEVGMGGASTWDDE